MIILARVVGQQQFGEFGMVQTTLGVAGMMAGFGLGSSADTLCCAIQQDRSVTSRSSHNSGFLFHMVPDSCSWSDRLSPAAGFIAREVLHARHLQTALIWGTLLMMAMVMRGVQSGVLAGLERFDVMAESATLLEGIASLLGLVGLAWLFGIEGGLLGLAFGTFVAWLAGQYALRRTLRDHKVTVRSLSTGAAGRRRAFLPGTASQVSSPIWLGHLSFGTA